MVETPPAPARGRVLSDRQKLAWLRLIRSENVGPATFRTLLNHYGSAEAALDALPALSRRGGARRAIRVCPPADAYDEIDLLERLDARLVALGEPDYPALLRHADGPPPLLAMKGGAGLFVRHHPPVAIVGARNCSLAGSKIAGQIAGDLGAAGFIIVSGLARGIDAAAHAASLRTGTVAVFAGGLGHLYPPDNEALAARIIAEGGAWVSEMPPGWQPRSRDFPRRNRLISGISHGVVLVEAARRSGSLHTARFAAEQGRDVLAVPGSPLDPRCDGCNALIRDGAVLVRNADDVMAALDVTRSLPPLPPLVEEPGREGDLRPDDVGTDARQRIINALGPTPVDVDELIRHTDLSVSVVHIVLLELELAGRLERHPPNRVSLSG
ncbi:DNA processing protein [Breoghania corrubedonensis]|uniref:DNA processing protein n=1 Tax=Breoghania corrubedonensis TaxID=665038 RepID=A0A2T5VCH3_9HYPH|nr:DNA-processing protein DprA [Breoghania corrubedonensis]PTW61463.1 DNA processing protein [Breoghania corrubedonensis]